MATMLTHRHTCQQYEVKETPCYHHMLRQVYRDCSGLKRTNWQRVPASTVEQLRKECIEVNNETLQS